MDIYQVDAFTKHPYGGNPAGVVLNASGLDENQMLCIAREMNLSETAFVFPGDLEADFTVRFFTPTEEVDLCGHATIATFHLLHEKGLLVRQHSKQRTKAGVLSVEVLKDGQIFMEQAYPQKIDAKLDDKLLEVMVMNKDQIGLETILDHAEIWSTGLPDILLPVKNVEILKNITPSMSDLEKLSREIKVSGVHAFTIDEKDCIWCRNFAPACGILEEAATGTSNGALGACLYNHKWRDGSILEFISNQGQWMKRPSQIHVKVDEKGVCVGGYAVTVIEGNIKEPLK